jgi:general secretion pathway protein L
MSRPDKIFPSVGLPLNGLVKTRVDLNLVPPEMRRKVREIGKPVFMILTSLAILLCLTLGLGVLIRYRSELQTVNAEVKKRKPEVEAVQKLQKQRDTLGREMVELEKVRAGEVSKVDLLRELTQVLPETVWIWNLKYNGKEIEISGFAESASDLIPLLDKSPLFERVEFLSPVTKERSMRGAEVDKEKERFKIRARIEGRRGGS